MHLPFLQVPDDVWPKARTLARILRVPEFQGIGLAVALDAWALQCATDGDVSGVIDDQNPAEAIALAVGWEGDAAVLFAALVRVRLVEESPDGVRVTTLEKYAAAVVRPGKRSEAASKAATERWQRKKDAERTVSASTSHGDAMRLDAMTVRTDAKMQSKTQTEIKNLPASQGASAPDADEDLPDATAGAVEVEKPSAVTAFVSQAPLLPEALATQPAKPKRSQAARREPTGDQRHAPLVAAIVEAHRDVKGAPYGFAGGRDAKAVTELLALADQNPATRGKAAPAEILRRWGIALRWRGFPACTGLLSFRDNWNAYVREQDAQHGSAFVDEDKKRRAPHPGSDWSKAPHPEPVPTVKYDGEEAF